MTNKRLTLLMLFLVGAVFISLYISFTKPFDKVPWDFSTYYFATKTFFVGGDPYSVPEINRINNVKISLPFLYHPYFLLLFCPLIKFSLESAAKIYLLFNILMIFYLLWLWHTLFEGKTKIFLLVFLFFFSFNYFLNVIFGSGNIPLIEAAILWSAFYFLLKDKPLLFVVLLLIVSIFKIFSVFLLPMVLFSSAERRKHIGKIILGSIAIWLLPFLFVPRLFFPYIERITNVAFEKGMINPCSYSLIVDIFERWGWYDEFLPNLIYLIWVGIVLYFFWQSLRKLQWKKDKLNMVYLCLLTFIITVPRFKDYSYVLAVPVAYEMILKNIQFIFLPFFNLFYFVDRSHYYIFSYNPLFTVTIFWVYLICSLGRKSTEEEKNFKKKRFR